MSERTYKFKQHPLTAAEKLWLSEAANQLPHGFTPESIDPRLYFNSKVTPVGLRLVAPDNPLLAAIDKTISAIQNRIVADPDMSSITVEELAREIGLAPGLVNNALEAAQFLGNFVPSSSGSNSQPYSSVQFTGDHAFDAYIQYDGLEDLLERFYIERGKALEQSTTATNGVLSPSREPFEFPVHERRVRQNTAFVLMAIDPSNAELEDVYKTIKDVCREFGINAYRADDIEHQKSITERVLSEIKTCEYLIADLSLERPNVYYEVGHAHALDLHPVLYRKAGTRLHFDLSVHNVPEYKNATELRKLLRRRLGAITGRSPPTEHESDL